MRSIKRILMYHCDIFAHHPVIPAYAGIHVHDGAGSLLGNSSSLRGDSLCRDDADRVRGRVTFCSGTKSNQKSRRSNAAGAWHLPLEKYVHARCGGASCPSSRAAITLGVLPRSVAIMLLHPPVIPEYAGIHVHDGAGSLLGNSSSLRGDSLCRDDADRVRGLLLFVAAQKVTKKAAPQIPAGLGLCWWTPLCHGLRMGLLPVLGQHARRPVSLSRHYTLPSSPAVSASPRDIYFNSFVSIRDFKQCCVFS